MMKVVGHWNRLPRQVMDVPCVEGLVGQGFEQSYLVENVIVHGRGVELDDL